MKLILPGRLSFWSGAIEAVKSLELKTIAGMEVIGPASTQGTALMWSDKTILIGTAANDIWEFSLAKESVFPLVRGHFTGGSGIPLFRFLSLLWLQRSGLLTATRADICL